jgi:hypothetical protein
MDRYPLTVAGYELEGLEAACMSRDTRIVVLFNDTALSGECKEPKAKLISNCRT